MLAAARNSYSLLLFIALAVCGGMGLWAVCACAQDGIPPADPFSPPADVGDSSLGPAPGEHRSYGRESGSVVGGRPGAARPRVLPGQRTGPPATARIVEPVPPPRPRRPRAAIRLPQAITILSDVDDEGPDTGWAWEQAVAHLARHSRSLRAKSLEIPQARADVLTAGMLANPVITLDGQLIPYRPYNSVTNPGGPSQYDLNVLYPVDVTGKRQARIDVACAAERAVEAQYQNAVRLEIDRLATIYVDALAARISVRTARLTVARFDDLLVENSRSPSADSGADARRQLSFQRRVAGLAAAEAEATWRNSQRALAAILDLPREQANLIDLRGSLDDDTADPPDLEWLVALALASRPDLAAQRLGVGRATADARLAEANRLPDIYVLYQPLTYQDNRPFSSPSSRSWAVGATVTIPLFDRNQGNIEKARYNIQQTRAELTALERSVIAEVDESWNEYQLTNDLIDEIRGELLPVAIKEFEEFERRRRESGADATVALGAQREIEDLARQYRELLIRHRRAMLDLNTAVGVRVMQ